MLPRNIASGLVRVAGRGAGAFGQAMATGTKKQKQRMRFCCLREFPISIHQVRTAFAMQLRGQENAGHPR
jgi:hypothetical protein